MHAVRQFLAGYDVNKEAQQRARDANERQMAEDFARGKYTRSL